MLHPSQGAQSTLLSSVPFQTQAWAASSHRAHRQHVKSKSQAWYNLLTSCHLPHSTAKDTGILLHKVSDLLYINLYLDKAAAATPRAPSFEAWSFWEKLLQNTTCQDTELHKDWETNTSAKHPLPQVTEKTAHWAPSQNSSFMLLLKQPRWSHVVQLLLSFTKFWTLSQGSLPGFPTLNTIYADDRVTESKSKT